MKISGYMRRAHRVAYILHTQTPIPEGMQILHHCDNRVCCNPNHLYMGTHDDNIRDKNVRNRCVNSLGERNGMSKLTASIVRKIRRLQRSYTQRKLAQRFNVSEACIWGVVSERNWRHIL